MSDEVVLRVSNGNPQIMEPVGLQQLGYWERTHLQEWVAQHPSIVGPNLLLITTEFARWEFGDRRVSDRLDLLFLTEEGAPLIAELKRGEAPDTVDLQALKYAAYCSQFTIEDLVEAYREHHTVSADDARTDILEHAPALEEEDLAPVRVRLVAEDFKPSVTTTVMWMYERFELDIGCVKLSARSLSNGEALLVSRLIVPPPAAEDYIVRVRRRQREEERLQEASRRRPNAVPRLLAAGEVEPGTPIKLRLSSFSRNDRQCIDDLLQKDESIGQAEWTGEGATTVLRWRYDGNTYSASKLIVKILQECGARPVGNGGSAHGPSHWETPEGKTLWELAEEITSEEESR